MRRNRLLAVVPVLAAIAAATAPAAQAMSVSLGQPELTARLAIDQPVTVNCTAFDPSLTMFSAGASVNAEQASGRSIARGVGFVSGWVDALPFQCDGNDHTLHVPVTADVNGPPFHGGQVVISAYAGAQAGLPCGNGCFYGSAYQNASAGPAALKMH
jgi:hypothetical protein